MRSCARVQRPQRAPIVVLTGTDLYRDIRTDAAAQRSLQQAGALVVLQELGLQALPDALRAKGSVIFRSAARLAPGLAAGAVLRVVQVGHLREETDPLCFMRAAFRGSRPHAGRGPELPLARRSAARRRSTTHPPCPPSGQHQPHRRRRGIRR